MRNTLHWRRYVRYVYPTTAAYVVVMVTVIVALILLDPSFGCTC